MGTSRGWRLRALAPTWGATNVGVFVFILDHRPKPLWRSTPSSLWDFHPSHTVRHLPTENNSSILNVLCNETTWRLVRCIAIREGANKPEAYNLTLTRGLDVTR
jgi:hypothetical protein